MQSLDMIERLRLGSNILCLGAHSDDLEIGCGATMGKLADHGNNITVNWVVFSASDQRKIEATDSANDLLRHVNDKTIHINNIRNGYFPYCGTELKDLFESLKDLPNPDIIFTHFRDDLHQDHRMISELTWNTFRDHLIVEYEIPKYDGDLGSPNLFVELKESDLARKIELLQKHFQSQSNKQWFTPDTFVGLSRLRGIQCSSASGFAESFYARKLVIG